MNCQKKWIPDSPLRLKKTTGWFPAGEGFLQAIPQLSDGAFKLFVFLCLQADRQTATYAASHCRLASALGKSKPAVEAYISELKNKGLCLVHPSRVPYLGTTFRIGESYWPYQSLNHDSEQKACGRYVTAVRELFLGLECTSGRFGPPEERQARDLEKRGISLQELEDAMIVAACRKYVAWLNHGPSDSIASLRYFESLLEEVRQRPFPPGYRDYLRMEVKRLAELWKRSRAKNQQPSVSENDSSTSNHPNREISAPSSEKETR